MSHRELELARLRAQHQATRRAAQMQRMRTRRVVYAIGMLGALCFLALLVGLHARESGRAQDCRDRGGVWLSREQACVAGPLR